MRKAITLLIMVMMGAGCTPAPIIETPASGAILPHHLFVEAWMDEFYGELAHPEIKQILLISPNHFGYGFDNIRSTTQPIEGFNSPKLNIQWIQTLADSKSLSIETQDFEKEHGITSHLNLISNHFPQAKITPIMLKPGTTQKQLDALILAISRLDLSETLIIASIDFTHLEPESIALENDQRTIDWLHAVSAQPVSISEVTTLAQTTAEQSLEGAVAIDSPESLYVLVRLMQAQQSSSFSLWDRTSTLEITGSSDPAESTTHIFGAFR